MGNNRNLFWQLVKKEHRHARAFCYRLTGNYEDGDDLYQDSVIKAYHGFSVLKQTGSFRPWLYRIIGNTYRSRFRNPWWKKVFSLKPEVDSGDFSKNPEDLYESRRRLNFAFSVLSVDDRLLVTLAEIEGWKIAELAEITGKTEGLIKMRLARARKKMRRKLSCHYKKKTFRNYINGT